MSQSDFARVARAIEFLSRANGTPSLEETAAHVGLSPSHFQRLFERWAGVSPKRFLQFQTLSEARRLLAEGDRSLLEVTHDVGLSSPSRLHALVLSWETMTPGELRHGTTPIRWGVHQTPLGAAVFACTERGLCGVEFLASGDEVDGEAEAEASVRRRWPKAPTRHEPAVTAPFAAALNERLAGVERPAPLSLLLGGTPFQMKVWEALLRIPPGRVTTYGALARELGAPSASRAVGSAVGANPLAVLVPCHRVIQASGAMGGYRWGEPRKRALLGLEWCRTVS